MKYLLIIFALVAFLVMPQLAYAGCTTQFITLPDGRSMSCMTCCYGNVCQTNCS